ncbi:MAG: Stp1/IreP family PP2C-type Ser/Thr phosphatase [Eggerthellaceae bacterium]|nr:Stp1/IreP family PP2C-type Ser/Thr phosphatase [Eggerthellaceae bacterium]
MKTSENISVITSVNTFNAPGTQSSPDVRNVGAATDVGYYREHNEDSYLAEAPLFAVADGMGGHNAGEVASKIAIDTLVSRRIKHANPEELGTAIMSANIAILNAAFEGESREGMGTTLTAAVLDGLNLLIGHVGDSRAYVFAEGNLQQITRDHSLVANMVEAGQITEAEARVHPKRSIITRALGIDPNMAAPDLYEVELAPGDRILICSDGLTGMVPDEKITVTMRTVKDAQECAETLIKQALQGGGHDNITAIVVNVTDKEQPKKRRGLFGRRH